MVVYVAVCEIFSVKEWCDLENGVRARSRSLEMAIFDRSHTSSYSLFVSFARYSDLLVENREFFLPHLYLTPRRGWPRRNFVKMFDASKTRMIGLGYRMVKILWLYVKPFSSDTGTLRTDGHICYINIAHQHTALLTRDKNDSCSISVVCRFVLANKPLISVFLNKFSAAQGAFSWFTILEQILEIVVRPVQLAVERMHRRRHQTVRWFLVCSGHNIHITYTSEEGLEALSICRGTETIPGWSTV